MNKNDLVQQLSDRTGLAKHDAGKAVDGVFDAIETWLRPSAGDGCHPAAVTVAGPLFNVEQLSVKSLNNDEWERRIRR